jgi:hypoxanthine phosphoribosyltransferase
MNLPIPSKDTFLELLIPEEAIFEKILEISETLNREYEGKELFIVAILKGSLCLVSDLIRHLNGPNDIEFIRCESYGMKGHLRGTLRVIGLEQLKLEGKHVLIVDDIFDSGNTIAGVLSRIQEMKPASLKTLVLLSKRVPRKMPYQPNYVLFEIEDRFVVGYGLDYKEHFRGLKGVYALLLENLPSA